MDSDLLAVTFMSVAIIFFPDKEPADLFGQFPMVKANSNSSGFLHSDEPVLWRQGGLFKQNKLILPTTKLF